MKRKPFKHSSSFNYKFSSAFSGTERENFSYVALPYETGGKGPKVLFVLDYMPSEDLSSGKLLSGVTGDILNMLVGIASKLYLKKPASNPWMAVTYNAYRTAGKPKEYQDRAKDEFTKRVNSLIDKYKPDVVVGFGRQVTQALIPKNVQLTDGRWTSWLGVPVPCTSPKKHKYNYVGTLSLNPLTDAKSSDAALIGYMARNLANGLANKHLFSVDAERLRNHETVLVDTLEKFDEMMDYLRKQPYVACDTEANNLNRIVNKLLIIQFAASMDVGYVLPIYHKDSPFTASELKHIRLRLKSFFEGRNKNTYHIYANAQFDLNLNRTQLRTRYMANRVWDIFGGDFALDENMKFFENATGDWYYSLGNLSIQYGCNAYLEGDFGKEDRSNIANTDLDGPLLRYCSYDVVIPFAIHEQQKRLAAHLGHAAYETLVSEQFSDMLHGFSRMETNGSKLDVDYLFYLKGPQSPIEAEIRKMEAEFLKSPAVAKANARLCAKKGHTSKGLFAGRSDTVFSLRTNAHKQLLFFDVLELAPIAKGATGEGKLDKAFQEAYASVPEVAAYTGIGKAKKLRDAFVKAFIKQLGKSADLRSDHRIRPRYNYLKVVTNRTSASDPNLQQIPSRSALGKNIKRLFIARVGSLYIKVDYRVHEVRGWGLISFDNGVAELFKAAKKLRDSYRLHPTPEVKARLKAEADVHIMNAAYFFGVPIDQVDKALRNDVKSVIFGLIYQMSLKTLAGVLGRSEDYTKKLVANFMKRFPSGMKWIEDAKKCARNLLFYENPLGFRRHLWSYALPDSVPTAKKLKADADRRAVNSPVQGMCAEFMAIGSRAIDEKCFNIYKTESRTVDLKIENSVHDSLENTAAYADFLESIGIIEQSLTKTVKETVFRRHGFKFVVDLEIDFEIGSSLSNCDGWDFSLSQLEQMVYESIVFQKVELKYDVDVVAAMREVFVSGWERAPKWMHIQAERSGWKFDAKKYILLEKERVAKTAVAGNVTALPRDTTTKATAKTTTTKSKVKAKAKNYAAKKAA